jgi:putative protein-disulfide isomerase
MKKNHMVIEAANQNQINSSLSSPGNRQQVEVVFYTDPLCCWSWAFEPQWRKLQFEFAGLLKIRYCMTGLIRDWKSFNDTVNNVSRPAQMGPVWMQAAHMSGMPVNTHVWVNDPPASSYLACMAVKAAALQSDEAGSAYLRAVREAIMLHGINISKAGALLKIADTLAIEQPDVLNINQFKEDLAGNRAKDAFQKDLAEVKLSNIVRCPGLVFRYADKPALLMTGYRSYADLLKVIQHLVPGIQKVQEANSADLYSRYWKTITSREIEVACGIQ